MSRRPLLTAGGGTLLMVLLAGPVLAQAAPSETATATTHATAEERLPNTVADVLLGIEQRAATVEAVQSGLAAASKPLLDYLRGAGVSRLRTQDISVQPVMQQGVPGHGPPHVVGYEGRLTVALRATSGQLGAVLSGALSHGATTIDSTAQRPTEQAVDDARDRLAAEATKRALSLASAVADAAGRRAGPVRTIEVDPAGGPVRPFVMRAAAAAIATAAGDTEVSASVTVTVTLQTQ